MSNNLLPSNATAEEVALSMAIAPDLEPEAIKAAWRPETCPALLLPWLAWAYHVDDWDDTWNDEVKRAVVLDAIDLHRYKGTVWAVKTALKNVGYPASLKESQVAYIFDVSVSLPAGADMEQSYINAVKYAESSKNERSHIGIVSMQGTTQGTTNIGHATVNGIRSELWPLVPECSEAVGSLAVGAISHSHIFTEIYPLAS